MTTTVVSSPASGATSGYVAAITQDTVRNVLDVAYFLTDATGAATGTTIQVDYDVAPATGAFTVRDTVFSFNTGKVVATYYGDEATNPVFTANPNFKPPNPGYAVTQYTYSSPGVLAQVVAYDAYGRVYIGT